MIKKKRGIIVKNISTERVKELIQQATTHLLEAELLEENGWSKEDVEILEYIAQNDFRIEFTK